MDWKKVFTDVNRQVSSTYDTSVESLLERMGLEQKRSTMEILLPVLGVFGAGIAVGATLGLLFAPKRGDEMRGDLRHRLEDLRERVPSSYDELRARGREALDEIQDDSTSSIQS
ncbi:MAG: YtxH domain-containing protein [Bradymonadaceae bacterium]|nr:YtxH domain-containing protein [Lujinxingiaceae bacterium]